MNPAEIDALVASAKAAKAAGQPLTSLMDEDGALDPLAPQLSELDLTGAGGAEIPIGAILDLTLPVSIELGRTSMTVQELLLDRLAGEPIDIFVGSRRFAEGEVVLLGEHFGVRVRRVLAASAAVAATEATV